MRFGSLILVAAGAALLADARKFYDDDPVRRAPAPVNVTELKPRKLNDWYDFYRNTFQDPGDGIEEIGPVPAQSVNTLGEVLDSEWYTNRGPLTREQILRGPGNTNAPDASAPWQITGAKTQGVTPGFFIRDARKRRYLLKFDPIDNAEMATGADVVTAKLLWALGYNAPENYIVEFTRNQLTVDPKTSFTDQFGRYRRMKEKDVGEILLRVPRVRRGGREMIRAVASYFVEGRPLGEFKYYGIRRGDKNDFIPHEHRRELRGLHVIAAWLNHNDSRAINTFDSLVTVNGVQFVRHYLLDFGSTLGSAAVRSKSARDGNEYLYAFRPAAVQLLTLGLYVPPWARAHYPYYPSIGRIQWDHFDPDKWVPNYRNRAFLNRLPDDEYWGAKQVMRLSEDDIRAVVALGQYSDKEAEAWLAESLIRRRETVGRVYFDRVLPLDNFAVRDGSLVWDDLAVKHGFAAPRQFGIRWARFDNESEKRDPVPGAATARLPSAPAGSWSVATITSDSKKSVHVYVHHTAAGPRVVGVERTW